MAKTVPTGDAERIALLHSLIEERILVVDGAMGTSIQGLNLAPEDFGGPDLDGCNEMLNLLRPDLVHDIHLSFLDAGADVVETNTFGSTPLVLAEYGLAPDPDRTDADLADLEGNYLRSGGVFRVVVSAEGPP